MSSKQATSNNQPHRALSGPQSRRGPKIEKKNVTMRDNVPQLSQEQLFFRSDPQVGTKGDLLGFWPVLGCGHLEKFQAQKQKKTQFFRRWGSQNREKKLPRYPGWLSATFLRRVFPERNPRGGKSWNSGFLGPFGLGQPLGT